MKEGPAPEVSGGRISPGILLFTKDAKYFLCAVGSVIKLFSVATGATVQVLRGHTAAVTALALDPTNSQRLVSGGSDGTVRFWDYIDARQHSECVELAGPVFGMAMHANWKGQLFVGCRTEDGKESRMLQYDLRKGSSQRLCKVERKMKGLLLGHEGSALVSLAKKKLMVYNLRLKKLIRHTHSRLLTAVATSPSEQLIATGDVSGKITLWYNATQPADSSDASTHLSISELHWHAHQVSALIFSSSGGWLMSGGQESVLVQWNLKGSEKTFLPRQGGTEIISIATDIGDTQIGVATLDNSLRILDSASLTLSQRVEGVYPPSTTVACPLATGSQHHSVWMVGRPGSLQLWDLEQNRSIAELSVVNQNLLSRTNEEVPLWQHVQFVAASACGSHLVTCDRREGTAVGKSAVRNFSRLKFWESAASGSTVGRFILSSQSTEPHQGLISAICFEKHTPQLATAGEDGKFKLWRVGGRKNAPLQSQSSTRSAVWGCAQEQTYCGEVASCADFAADGSLLALGFSRVLTLWSLGASTMQLLFSAPHQAVVGPLQQLSFVAGAPVLAVGTNDALIIWDLLSMQIRWQFTGSTVKLLLSHPSKSALAVVVDVQKPSKAADSRQRARPD